MSYVDYTTLIRDLLIDLVSIYFVTYVILYRKFQNIEMFVACALFNIFIMLIVMAIIRTDFNIAVGFGLFALLSLIQVRSAQFTKTETAYILGSVSLAVINGAGITDLTFVLISNFVVIAAAWLFGTWSLEHSTNLITVDYVRKMTVTLDHINEELVADRELMKNKLTDMLGSQIQSFEIKKLDYVREIVEVSVTYELPARDKAQPVNSAGKEPALGPALPAGGEGWGARTMLQHRESIAEMPPVDAGVANAAPFKAFEAVSLEEVNRLAKMQTRLDNKYIADLETVCAFAHRLKSEFAVLEIGDRREFSYRSCYYDDGFRCYFDHHQGRRQRFKARTRQYVDGGGLTFFEVKLKGARGLTVKNRVESDFVIRPKIDGQYRQLLQESYLQQYRKPLDIKLSPSLLVHYKRYTLVALKGGERVTIDHQLSFSSPEDDSPPIQLGNGFMIIETKSARGRGVSDKVLESLKVGKESGCSKYCIGVNLIGSVSKSNAFGPTLKRVRQNVVAGDGNTAARVATAANGQIHGPRLAS